MTIDHSFSSSSIPLSASIDHKGIDHFINDLRLQLSNDYAILIKYLVSGYIMQIITLYGNMGTYMGDLVMMTSNRIPDKD